MHLKTTSLYLSGLMKSDSCRFSVPGKFFSSTSSLDNSRTLFRMWQCRSLSKPCFLQSPSTPTALSLDPFFATNDTWLFLRSAMISLYSFSEFWGNRSDTCLTIDIFSFNGFYVFVDTMVPPYIFEYHALQLCN